MRLSVSLSVLWCLCPLTLRAQEYCAPHIIDLSGVYQDHCWHWGNAGNAIRQADLHLPPVTPEPGVAPNYCGRLEAQAVPEGGAVCVQGDDVYCISSPPPSGDYSYTGRSLGGTLAYNGEPALYNGTCHYITRGICQSS